MSISVGGLVLAVANTHYADTILLGFIAVAVLVVGWVGGRRPSAAHRRPGAPSARHSCFTLRVSIIRQLRFLYLRSQRTPADVAVAK